MSDFIKALNPPLMISLAGLSERSQVQVEGTVVGSNFPCGYIRCDGADAAAHPRAAIEFVVDGRNVGLTHNKKILMCCHFKLGHFFLGWIHFLIRGGKGGEPPVILTHTNCKAHYCKITGLLCSLCKIGKGSHQSSGAKYLVEVDPGVLCADDLVLGQKVSVDQYVSKVKGRLAHSCGTEKVANMYNGSSIFVDHATKLTYVANQTLLIAAVTVVAHQMFERFALGCGVCIKQYHVSIRRKGNNIGNPVGT
eukprot:14311553-Ditylum_brightwellii.AAC.1